MERHSGNWCGNIVFCMCYGESGVRLLCSILLNCRVKRFFPSGLTCLLVQRMVRTQELWGWRSIWCRHGDEDEDDHATRRDWDDKPSPDDPFPDFHVSEFRKVMGFDSLLSVSVCVSYVYLSGCLWFPSISLHIVIDVSCGCFCVFDCSMSAGCFFPSMFEICVFIAVASVFTTTDVD